MGNDVQVIVLDAQLQFSGGTFELHFCNYLLIQINLPYLLLIAIVNQHFQNDIENISFVVNYCI